MRGSRSDSKELTRPGQNDGDPRSNVARHVEVALAAYQSGMRANAIFNASDAEVSPSALASLLQGNPLWQELAA